MQVRAEVARRRSSEEDQIQRHRKVGRDYTRLHPPVYSLQVSVS